MCLSFVVAFRLTGPITLTDLRVAKTKWLRNGHESYQSETAPSADLKLCLFYEGEGIIRCREHPKYVDLPERRQLAAS